jgi:hypothetical protein
MHSNLITWKWKYLTIRRVSFISAYTFIVVAGFCSGLSPNYPTLVGSLVWKIRYSCYLYICYFNTLFTYTIIIIFLLSLLSFYHYYLSIIIIFLLLLSFYYYYLSISFPRTGGVRGCWCHSPIRSGKRIISYIIFNKITYIMLHIHNVKSKYLC